MNTFANAVVNQSARTENGMAAFRGTNSALVDLFFKIGASRGKNIIPQFTSALVEDRERALRIALWSRDVRGGAGERQLFRDILVYLGQNDLESFKAVAPKVSELGRWDDLLYVATKVDEQARWFALELIKEGLNTGNGLCAKWMPRKGPESVLLRTYLGWTPKFYRKRLVELTKVVETQMCAKDWDNINFSHVPSVASSRYKKAFLRNSKTYKEYVEKLVKGDKSVKVNASAIFPYDVLKSIVTRYAIQNVTKTEKDHIKAQWDALPNYVGDANILPLVDVSGSMTTSVSPGLSALDVAVSLGLYLADKNTGKFKDTFLTFSGSPELITLTGDIVQKVDQMNKSHWEMNTNLHAAIQKILDVAVNGNVPQEEMPAILLILSDMQFDRCVRYDDRALDMLARKYEAAGYTMPQVVFWNINSHENVPAKMDEKGVALVSGFSPAIVKTVLKADADKFTPEGIMNATIMNPRYDLAA
jgi:Domain of unknown function (DUF2828)